MYRYLAIYKPYGMISQFSASGDKPTLADLGIVHKDVYPLGRLDTDSEGLLILTNDKRLNHLLLNPKKRHWRKYLVQVDGPITELEAKLLEEGVEIKINKQPFHTSPARCRLLEHSPDLPDRDPPIRHRKAIPAPWIELQITEGKNRQVRKMTAKVGYPTLRLVRYAIEDLNLKGMMPGDVLELDRNAISEKLHLPILG